MDCPAMVVYVLATHCTLYSVDNTHIGNITFNSGICLALQEVSPPTFIFMLDEEFEGLPNE